MDINDYIITQSNFKKISSEVLNSNTTKNIYLIRFKDFIDEDSIIKDIISNKIKYVSCDCEEQNFIKEINTHYVDVEIPLNEDEHIKYIYNHLSNITKNKMDLIDIASKFYHKNNNYIFRVNNYITKVFKPLLDYIENILLREIKILDNNNHKQGDIIINNDIKNNYGSNNIAKGNISSINTVSNHSTSTEIKIKSLIEDILLDIKSEEICEDIKEEIIDELSICAQQIEQNTLRETRKNKVKDFISSTINKIPNIMNNGTFLIKQFIELRDLLGNL